MAQAKVSLNEIMTAVRELTFDRFIIPAFAVKQMGAGYFLDIDKTYIPKVADGETVEMKGRLILYKDAEPLAVVNDTINDEEFNEDTEIEDDVIEEGGTDGGETGGDNTEGGDIEGDNTENENPEGDDKEEEVEKEDQDKEIIVSIPFNEHKTLEEVMNALIEAGIVVAYTPYFKGTEPSNVLIKVTRKELTEDFTTFRRYFFSDEEIKENICWYYQRVLDINNVELSDEIVGRLVRPSERHLAIWVAYYMVQKRRLYEVAAGSIGQSFTDGSDYVGSDLSSATGTTTTTQIGSVFTITEDPTKGYFYEDYNRVGSDNVLGDRYSFWYKLMLYLRDLLETQFGDYSLRKDNVIPGYISLQRELDFRSYFDSYPFTLSPLSRGILSKTP